MCVCGGESRRSWLYAGSINSSYILYMYEMLKESIKVYF